MRCPSCGNRNAADAGACAVCGNDLVDARSTEAAIERLRDLRIDEPEFPCPSCGAVNAGTATFCTLCGQRFEGAPEPEPGALPPPPRPSVTARVVELLQRDPARTAFAAVFALILLVWGTDLVVMHPAETDLATQTPVATVVDPGPASRSPGVIRVPSDSAAGDPQHRAPSSGPVAIPVPADAVQIASSSTVIGHRRTFQAQCASDKSIDQIVRFYAAARGSLNSQGWSSGLSISSGGSLSMERPAEGGGVYDHIGIDVVGGTYQGRNATLIYVTCSVPDSVSVGLRGEIH